MFIYFSKYSLSLLAGFLIPKCIRVTNTMVNFINVPMTPEVVWALHVIVHVHIGRKYITSAIHEYHEKTTVTLKHKECY